MEDFIIILTQLFGWDLTENLNHQTYFKKILSCVWYGIRLKEGQNQRLRITRFTFWLPHLTCSVI